jgi:hypothetical protein
MAAKYVTNWFSVIPLYSKMKSNTVARFRDGKQVVVYSDSYLYFYEELYRRYLEDRGFVYETQGETTVVKTPCGLELRLAKLPYSFVLDEIFVMKVYGDLDLKGRSVIDIGASIGDSAIYFSSLGASKVYGFEMESELCEVAEENIKRNNLTDKVQVFNQQATAKLIDTFILQNVLKNILMKIDCEGCEYEIVYNMSDESFQCLNDIIMEYHGSAKPIVRKLSAMGFRTRKKKEILFASRAPD